MKTMTITLNEDGTFMNENGNELTLKQVIAAARARRDSANAEKKAARDRVKLAKAGQRKAKLLAQQAKLEKQIAALTA
jgi:hypothetical protein